MSEDFELTILNRDIEDAFPEADIGNRSLNCKLAKEPFYLFSIEMKGNDSWIIFLEMAMENPCSFVKGFTEEVNHY